MPVDRALKMAVRDGIGLAYADIGAGDPPLLFIHGWCCDRSHWREQILAFQNEHRTVAVDLRGHGASDKPDQDYGIGLFVDDMAWICAETGLERPVVVGHSMGGVIGMNLVRKHPGLARGLVMVDSPVVPLPDALQATADAVFAGLKSPAYVDVSKNFVNTFMFREDSDPELKLRIIEGMASAPQRVMWTALSDTLSPANIEPGPIPVPTLFVRASTAISSAEQITSRYPGVALREFDAAHFLMMEKPAEFNEILREFLRGLM
jgi:pimeloyl-ACP methyl ester carboxylesterase